MAEQQPGASDTEERVDSRTDDRLDAAALAAIEEAEQEAPDPSEFGLQVDVPKGDVAIRVKGLGVRYNLNFTKKTKLHTTFARMLDPRRRNKGHFWALRNVDFEVRRGEAVGIIGPNGSGKSTILLALAGILQPSEGVVEVDGHISTLLSLNAGFDQELTGRENIALAGALMGIDHDVMREITPGIVRFANIGAFIDAPMKTYSSGMRARVGFSIATSVDPDILLLDEVLGTGDNRFKKKSKVRIANVLKSAKAVVMVTHDMSWITSFCTRAILLDKGRIVADGDPAEIVEMHGADAAFRKMQKRKAKQLMMHGKISTTDINKALKAGTMGDLLEGHEEDLAEIDREKAEKRAALEEKRARKRAEQKAAGEPVDDEPDSEQEDEEHAELTAADTPADELLAEAKSEAREEADADEQLLADGEVQVDASSEPSAQDESATDEAEADKSEAGTDSERTQTRA